MAQLTIPQDEAEMLLYDNIAEQEVSKHRWYTKKLIVFRDTNLAECLLGIYHLEPVSELQEGQDEWESDPVKVYPVKARQQTITVYEAAELVNGE